MAKKKRTSNGYGAYLFREKDPVIDMTRTLFEDIYGRRIDYKMLAEIEKEGGPTVGCMAGWFFGETKKPRNDTIEAAGRSRGYQRQWVKIKK